MSSADPESAMEEPRLETGLNKTISTVFSSGSAEYHDKDMLLIRKYDKNGDGVITTDEAFAMIKDLRKQQEEKRNLKMFLWLALFLSSLVLISSFGLTWAVIILSREIKTTDNGDMVAESTNSMVGVRSRGYLIDAEVNSDWATPEGLRSILNGETPAYYIGDPIFSAALADFEENGTPVTVRMYDPATGKEEYLRLSADHLVLQEDETTGKTTILGVHLPIPSFVLIRIHDHVESNRRLGEETCSDALIIECMDDRIEYNYSCLNTNTAEVCARLFLYSKPHCECEF